MIVMPMITFTIKPLPEVESERTKQAQSSQTGKETIRWEQVQSEAAKGAYLQDAHITQISLDLEVEHGENEIKCAK